ncbi:hypothetical protein KY290_033904 [Solanum tuberosum]|uniref:Cytokinin riboside 5'-monophosphate phosphoribohydrolase n=2 Tax=Solanum TaxID=4107 RepID=A0ABQ7U1P4_SOLTU|nr:hypothetical protein KY289_033278 [Solanum tuberosum]KAH0647924.1 hypothetical protein KY285_033172 [Solanum tuberosum]KAH0740861.1 hypothetical protein KY290_033904 [Solanum tuberosum]
MGRGWGRMRWEFEEEETSRGGGVLRKGWTGLKKKKNGKDSVKVECGGKKKKIKVSSFGDLIKRGSMENNSRSKFKKICVFCGSNPGHRKVFSDAAIDLGNELVSRKIDLVYGGGSVGLMGLISQRVQEGGCHVLGVIPKALVPIEISGESVGDVKIVSDMHERKAEMASQADAFIALPGGYGTMEETLEMITWAQLGIHKKPVGLLNVEGYYNSLLALFDNGVEEGFIKPGARDIVLADPSARELLSKMEQYTPSHDHVAPHESWHMEELAYPKEESA